MRMREMLVYPRSFRSSTLQGTPPGDTLESDILDYTAAMRAAKVSAMQELDWFGVPHKYSNVDDPQSLTLRELMREADGYALKVDLTIGWGWDSENGLLGRIYQ